MFILIWVYINGELKMANQVKSKKSKVKKLIWGFEKVFNLKISR